MRKPPIDKVLLAMMLTEWAMKSVHRCTRGHACHRIPEFMVLRATTDFMHRAECREHAKELPGRLAQPCPIARTVIKHQRRLRRQVDLWNRYLDSTEKRL